jgi:hypothetical protein
MDNLKDFLKLFKAMEFTGEQRQLLDTADAWLQLGDYNSANEELEKLPPELRAHSEVFRLR